MIDLLHGRHSLAPMWDQVEAFGAVVRQFSQDNLDGVHLLCYSQGGLICRGIIESMPDINVSTFVSLSSPQGGQYGGYYHILSINVDGVSREKWFMSPFPIPLSVGNGFKHFVLERAIEQYRSRL